MKNRFVWIILLSSLVFFSSCPKIKEPPMRIDPINVPEVNYSTISIPIEVEVSKIEDAVWRSIKSPVKEGRTEEIDIKVLALEKITERELIKELVSPFAPGHWETRYRTIERKVQRAYICLLKPLKWGECYKDVIELVKESFQVYIEPVEAVYRYVSQDITKTIDKAFDISGWINYKVFVESIDINVLGNEIASKVDIRIPISLDYKQNIIPWGPDLTIKGALSCEVRARIEVKGNMSMGDDANIVVDLPEDAGSVTFQEICIPSAVEAFDLISKLSPELYLARLGLGKILDEKVTDAISKAVNKNAAKLQFKDEIIALSGKIASPKLVSENIWITPRLTEIIYTDLAGDGRTIKTHVGVILKPEVRYSETPPPLDPQAPSLNVRKVNGIDPKTELLITATVNLKMAAAMLDSSITHLVDEKYPDLPFVPRNVQLYASGSKAVIALDIVKQKNGKKIITVFLWAIPKYDKDRSEMYLDEVEFTAESKIMVVKYLAAFAEDKIVEEIEKRAHWSVESEKVKILDKIQEFSYTNENFIVSGKFNDLDISNVFISQSDFVVFVTAKGILDLKYDPTGFASSTNGFKTFDPQQVINADLKQNQIGLTSNALNRKSTMQASLNSPFAQMSMASGSAQGHEDLRKVISKIITHVGDTIYQNGSLTHFRIATQEDASKLGDTIYVKNFEGEIQQHILMGEDWLLLKDE